MENMSAAESLEATEEGLARFDGVRFTIFDRSNTPELRAKALYARLRNGAEDVCSSFEGRDLAFKKLWQSCFDSAVASAVAQINRTGLTTLHNQTVSRSKVYR